jgi:hypothetical protein
MAFLTTGERVHIAGLVCKKWLVASRHASFWKSVYLPIALCEEHGGVAAITERLDRIFLKRITSIQTIPTMQGMVSIQPCGDVYNPDTFSR